MDQQYKGLSNIGATCYMNSLLQTLFMTPEFRQAIYQWRYNEKIHPKPQDSILYQLQKLFGKLQKKFPGDITTRDLVKSFQWHDEQAQMQQDIQQFNRVLFEALQKSLKSKKQPEQSSNHFVRDLYEGQMIHYTHCKQCENQSQKEEYFQDLILTVKNPYEKVYNNCVELGLQRYMKPEILDHNNLYSCGSCHKMVQAQRGVRFLKMPKLLNIILRRFDFDYFTFQRVKVNDRVEFPHILNINNYMQGYSNIQNKLNEDTSSYFTQPQAPKKPQSSAIPSSSSTHKKIVTKKSGTPSVAGKVVTKPSANTKSFLSEIRKKKIQSQEANQDLLYVSGNMEMLRKDNQSQLKVNSEVKSAKLPNKAPVQGEQAVSNAESNQQTNGKSESVVTENKVEIAKEPQQKQVEVTSSLSSVLPPPPPPPPLDLNFLPPPQLSQPYLKLDMQAGLTAQYELAIKLDQKQKLSKQKKQKLEQQHLKNKQLIQQYLKEGGLVYQLYAVMVHNGSATHGHYYSYIKSFQDCCWYCFNDDRVTEISVEEIQKTYGGVGHSNAYALYYRQVPSQPQQQKHPTPIPPYIQSTLQQQLLQAQHRQKQKLQNLQNILVLKIYYQLSVKLLQINKSCSMELCLIKAREMFQIPETVKLGNTRLRMFNPVSQAKLETFGGREDGALGELGIGSYKSLLLEVKKDEEVFEEYVPGQINLRIALWQQAPTPLQSLDETHLHLHKLPIPKNAKISQIQSSILQKRKQLLNLPSLQSPNNICIIKRHQNDQYSYHEVINQDSYRDKTIQEVMVMENQVVFVERREDGDGDGVAGLNWPREFQNQVYRITIKYVNGETGKVDSYLTDSRKTIGELKTSLCELLNLQPSDTIIKRGNKSGMELKNLSATMKDTRFISGTQVYLEKGLPAKPGQIRIQLFIASDAAEQCYNRLHQFEFIADVPINGQCKASEIKQLFSSVLKKYRNIDLDPSQFRIRQKVCDKIGKIYRERPMKQQQLIQKREIAIEPNSTPIDDKDHLIYVRIWNPQSWTLSKKFQLPVCKTTTMLDLATLIYAQNQEVPIEDMEICRILSLNKFGILDLCQMEYFQVGDLSVFGEPLFVNADGLMFVVKSSKKQPRSLTKQQQAKFGGNIKPNFKTTSKSRQPSSSYAKKQKGVTIKVVENKEQDQKEGEK